MKRLKGSIGLAVVALLIVVTVSCTDFYTNLLGLSYAFRRAEHSAMVEPTLHAKILANHDLAVKINAWEGEFDGAWTCAYQAYKSAYDKTPAGGKVVVNPSDFNPCMAHAWDIAFQLLTTVRAYDPAFLTSVVTYTLPNGIAVSYDPSKFSSSAPPAGVPATPAGGTLLPAKP